MRHEGRTHTFVNGLFWYHPFLYLSGLKTVGWFGAWLLQTDTNVTFERVHKLRIRGVGKVTQVLMQPWGSFYLDYMDYGYGYFNTKSSKKKKKKKAGPYNCRATSSSALSEGQEEVEGQLTPMTLISFKSLGWGRWAHWLRTAIKVNQEVKPFCCKAFSKR